MEYYSTTGKKEIMPFVATWMNLEITILSEISQTEKDKYHMISFIQHMVSKSDTNELTKEKQTHTENKRMVIKEEKGGKGGREW